MGDKLTPEERSAHMSRIRSKDTRPELVVRRLLHGLGFRYVLHDRRLPGTPDLVFSIRRKVVFVHGCFWHGHDCGRGFRPTKNSEFWSEKIAGNKARDRKHVRALRADGWQVLAVWECCTKTAKLPALERRLVKFLEA